MRRQILPAILMVVVMTVLLGAVYPLVSTAVGQVAFHDKANGSLVQVDGHDVGSSLIGQNFTEPQYFHGRPSAAGDGYDGDVQLGFEPRSAQPGAARRGRSHASLPTGSRTDCPMTSRFPSMP